jgi:glucan biosynthesis protein C
MTISLSAPDIVHSDRPRLYWIDYLRGLNILGTVAFHSFFAYSPFVHRLDFSFLINFPYVDPRTSLPYVDLLLLLRPVFSMQLMFFISGIFAWSSLQKRGALGYAASRFTRLIVPFAFMVIFVMPITFLPTDITFDVMQPHLRLAHLWFLWLLFAFDILLAIAFRFAQSRIERIMACMTNTTFYLVFAFLLLLVYMPFAQVSSKTGGWITLLGPLMLQISLVGIYLVYFVAGVLLGSRCISVEVKHTNIFSPFSMITRRPCVVYLVTALIWLAFVVSRLGISHFSRIYGYSLAWSTFNALYALAGLAIVASLILISKQFLSGQNSLLDNLSKDSYAIYLVHYTFVVWLQFLMNQIGVSGPTKPWLVLLLAIPISWLVADLLRRLPLASRFLVSG